MFIPPIDDAWDAFWKSVTWGLFARWQAGQAPLQPSRCLAQQMWLDKPTEVHYLVSESGFITNKWYDYIFLNIYIHTIYIYIYAYYIYTFYIYIHTIYIYIYILYIYIYICILYIYILYIYIHTIYIYKYYIYIYILYIYIYILYIIHTIYIYTCIRICYVHAWTWDHALNSRFVFVVWVSSSSSGWPFLECDASKLAKLESSLPRLYGKKNIYESVVNLNYIVIIIIYEWYYGYTSM